MINKLLGKSLLAHLCLCFCIIGSLLGEAVAKQPSRGSGGVEEEGKEYFILGLIGFNYTDRLIELYSVDNSGGGHVHLSSPTSGGSGVVCCTRIPKNQKEKIEAKVKWQVDGCVYPVKSSTGKIGERRIFHYKEAVVYLDPPVSSEPAYLETHFYPDGSVKVKATENISLPEIILDEDRKDRTIYSRCEHEKNSK